ncbi:tRNA(Met) cytidine acetyltransferase TmcA [Halomonas saccharevitans]|uniref:tRNA(Met) cytidine acetyltransferase TmcA n=1 Tax=Halomonas saccharevitans TaxID=416872 RepID=A0A1I7BKJ1_9GAMM|nr:GNAT family N-acetyltransferase [Halomonas saccharevitans]SFT87704.1 tRNA(Met) cytidine acetyltransferase [Halomonas saccharevitans]
MSGRVQHGRDRDGREARAARALLVQARRLARHRWRGLVWLSGEAEACRRAAHSLWQAGEEQGAWRAPLWIAAEPLEGLAASAWLPAAKARTRLGGEQDLVVIDAVSAGCGFDPEAFGALAGTLTAGGLLVLMTPPDWGQRPDADYARLAEHPWRAEQLSARYLARLGRLLGDDARVIRWTAGEAPRLPDVPEAMTGAKGEAPRESPSLPAGGDACLTEDQAEAVSRLTRLRRRRPLVLTADRGRGKTAALGIACARLLAEGAGAGSGAAEAEILVTAPRPAAVAGLFERLAALCPEGQRHGHAFEAPGGRVRFLAPDELARLAEQGEVGGPGRLLLVDEAAAIPAPLLGRWLEAFPRIAFATTVHGYEGSGRGFALRFRERLERQAPDFRECHLAEPIRWAPGDPLEALTSRLLLLDGEPDTAPSADGPLVSCRLDRDALAADEPRLRALFGLLVQAHYRTTPADLRRLLDGPGVAITTLEAGSALQGVAVCGDEGGFAADLAERVARGERRPRGHLLAQSLAAHAGERAALTARLRRVLRIAVPAGRRRERLGLHLLSAEVERARDEGIDLLGASFGAEPGLQAFWRSAGFRAVRLGLTRETATGEHALMVVRPTSVAGEALAERLQARFHRQLPGLLAFELAELEPAVALALLAEGPATALDAADRRDIEDVAFGHREPALARPAIQALVRRCAGGGSEGVDQGDDDERDEEPALLAAWAFQGRGANWLAPRLGVAGKKDVQAWLREAVARLHDRDGGLSPDQAGR